MIVIPASSTKSRNGNGKAATNRDDGAKRQQQQRRQPEYAEEPGWASAFERPDNEAPQPQFTGTGVLDRETLRAIADGDCEFQIAVWLRRSKTGKRYLRVHIEPPYQGSEQAEADEFFGTDADTEGETSGDDLPF